MPSLITELLKEELLRFVTFPVLVIFQLLNFWQNLSTVAYKAVAYKNRVLYAYEKTHILIYLYFKWLKMNSNNILHSLSKPVVAI